MCEFRSTQLVQVPASPSFCIGPIPIDREGPVFTLMAMHWRINNCAAALHFLLWPGSLRAGLRRGSTFVCNHPQTMNSRNVDFSVEFSNKSSFDSVEAIAIFLGAGDGSVKDTLFPLFPKIPTILRGKNHMIQSLIIKTDLKTEVIHDQSHSSLRFPEACSP